MLIPIDSPAHCCARCTWWALREGSFRPDGSSECAVWGETRYYKCPVCVEYEYDNTHVCAIRR